MRLGDGSYEHRDRDAGFVATIHSDGRVTFRSVAPVALRLPEVLGRDMLMRKRKTSDDEDFNARSNTLVHRGSTADAKNDLLINWGPYGKAPIMLSAGGRFGGLADLRAAGKGARAKAAFLERTRPLRERLAAEHRRRVERDALVELGARMSAIWNDPGASAWERKQRLFALWDDCVELGPEAGAEETARAGAAGKARRRIEAFIRREAAPGSAAAFTATELTRLNARRTSKARFDPYGSGR